MISASSPGRRPFTGFREGVIWVEEGYKSRLHVEARERLAVETWNTDDICSGRILSSVISTIEINTPSARNNLLEWEGRNGPDATDHCALVAAQANPQTRREAESALFDVYRGEEDNGEAFARCVDLFGRIYPLLGYLWFLKDAKRFVPVRPRGLQEGLERSGVNLRLVGRCSWENYQELIQALEALRPWLASALDLPEVTMLEAHAFVWVVGSWEAPEPGSSSRGYGYDAYEKAAYIIAMNIGNTVANANGQPWSAR